MKTKFCLSLLTLTSLVVNTQPAQAQTYQPTNRTPVADNTIGTQVSGNGNNFNITGGVTKGQTLFHSFTDFSVPTNGSANFLNPVGNRDIITRVTGNLFSDINGTVNTNGANFFLINPNGIVFGTNAKLNVGKAFVGSTANSIDLVDGSGRAITFGTNANGDAPLLSVAPNVLFDVSRLNMGGGNGAISNFGTLQTNNPSQYIGLIGGNVKLDGGQINALGGRVELGGLSAFGSVALGGDVNNLQVQFPSNVARGDVSFTNGARILVPGVGGGDIAITARNLEVLGGSFLIGGIFPGLGTPETLAGDIKLNATGEIAIVGSSGIVNLVGLNSKGNGGNITIDAGSLSLLDGGGFRTSTYGRGDAGNINVKVTGSVNIAGTNKNSGLVSGISSFVSQEAFGKSGNIMVEAGSLSLSEGANLQTSILGQGKGGNIMVDAGSLLLRDGASLETSTYLGQGDAGNINVKVTGSVDIAGINKNNGFPSGILSSSGTSLKFSGGNITIDAGSLSLRDGARFLTSTFGSGNAGNVTVTTKDAISLSGNSDIFSRVEAGSVGKGGDINIQAASLSLQDGARLVASTSGASEGKPAGEGDAGNITVKVSGAVDIRGTTDTPSFLTSDVQPGTKGNAGNITIDAGSLSLQGIAQLFTTTEGQGNAGTIKVNATDFVNISGKVGIFRSGLLVSSFSETGIAGDILVTSPKITLDNGGAIAAQSISGNGGNITIGGKLKGDSGFGLGSKIDPNNLTETDILLLRRNAQISTNASGTPLQGGDGGNININSKLIVAIPKENSDIVANAVKGRGGNVSINSQGLFGIQFRSQPTDNSDIAASSAFGQNGTVSIDTPGTDPGRDSTELPNTTTDASNQISQVCSANNRQNKLTVTGRGGLPPNANDPLTSDVVWQDARAASSQPAVSSATNNSATLPPPAVGWVFDGKGKVTLVAAVTPGQPTGTRVVCPQGVGK
jgi:filamentous hemagglutinin family protein